LEDEVNDKLRNYESNLYSFEQSIGRFVQLKNHSFIYHFLFDRERNTVYVILLSLPIFYIEILILSTAFSILSIPLSGMLSPVNEV
jgi:hypothetical protein